MADERVVEEVVRRVVAELAMTSSADEPAPATCSTCGVSPEPFEEELRHYLLSGACRVGASGCGLRVPTDLAGGIDHTLLKPDATEADIRKLCEEARRYQFASVCVNPCHVQLCAQLLGGSSVEVCTVVGFPLGATTAAAKAFETAEAVRRGATEIDMVINVGYLKGRAYARVVEDIRSVVCAADGRCVKVILETALLTDEEKVAGCTLAREAGADFVKTSTGFSTGGATAEDVALMRKTVGPGMGVKASGGIRDRSAAQQMLDAGASRIGASASVKIVDV